MKVSGDGFISNQGRQESERILARHCLVFHQLEEIIGKCRAFVTAANITGQDTKEDRQKVIALVLAVRLLEITEAALLVMKSGMSNEANTLFRVFLDAYFVFANVCSDAGFIAGYLESDEAARLKLLNSVEKHDSELFRRINEYATDQLKADLKQKIADENIQAFNSYVYADNVRCSEIYDSMYRLMSSSLHTTPRSLEKYVEEDRSGNIVEIKYYPMENDIPHRMYDFAYFLIKILSGLKEVFGSLHTEEIEAMIEELDRSANKHSKLRSANRR